MAQPFDGVHTPLDNRARLDFFSRLKNAVYAVWCYFSFSHLGALLDKGEAKTIDQFSARDFHPKRVNPKELLHKFDALYAPLKVRTCEAPLRITKRTGERKGSKLHRCALDIGRAGTCQYSAAVDLLDL